MSILLRERCNIKKPVEIGMNLGNPIIQLQDLNPNKDTYRCLFDPYSPRSSEERNTEAFDVEIKRVTFYTEFIEGVDNNMFLIYRGDTYNIQYVNPIRVGERGHHLDIICYLRSSG